MTSAAQQAANKRNAQKSSGPRTPEGKARSSANAIKHGGHVGKVDPIRSEILDEDPGVTQAIVNGILDALDPRNGLEFTSALSVATWTVGQLRVNRLIAPLVEGAQVSPEYSYEYLQWHGNTEFARQVLVALDVAEGSRTDDVDWLEVTVGLQYKIFSNDEIKRLRYRDPDGTVRPAQSAKELVADFLHVVDQQFTSRGEARDYMTAWYHDHMKLIDQENREVRHAEAQRILDEFERTTVLQERVDRSVARALKTYEHIRDRFPHDPPEETEPDPDDAEPDPDDAD